jgi:CBS domain-containing protein
MTRRHIGKVFVCDKEGKLLGLISKTDIMNVVNERKEYVEAIKNDQELGNSSHVDRRKNQMHNV